VIHHPGGGGGDGGGGDGDVIKRENSFVVDESYFTGIIIEGN